MPPPVILASGSAIRADLLAKAGVPFRIVLPRVDEDALRRSLEAEGAAPRDLADALAELKAARVSLRETGLVIGCDQVLALGRECFAKPASPEDAFTQLARLSGKTHQLLSAAVIYEDGQPVWRHVGTARMTMRPLSPAFIADYVSRNWESIRHAVGCYKLEEEGVRLFSAIEGSYFTVLGLPFLELLDYLTRREILTT